VQTVCKHKQRTGIGFICRRCYVQCLQTTVTAVFTFLTYSYCKLLLLLFGINICI